MGGLCPLRLRDGWAGGPIHRIKNFVPTERAQASGGQRWAGYARSVCAIVGQEPDQSHKKKGALAGPFVYRDETQDQKPLTFRRLPVTVLPLSDGVAVPDERIAALMSAAVAAG